MNHRDREPTFRAVREVACPLEQPFMLGHTKLVRAFGAQPTPHAEAIRDTVGWYRTRNEPPEPWRTWQHPGPHRHADRPGNDLSFFEAVRSQAFPPVASAWIHDRSKLQS